MRARWKACLPLASLVLAAMGSGCHRRVGEPDDAAELMRPQEVLSFDRLYNQNCSACHGVDGSGGPALDLANPTYQVLIDDQSLERSITAGIPGTQMPAFGESSGGFLTPAQVHALATGMRQRWSAAGADHNMPSYLAASTGVVDRGEQVYQHRCLSCHQGRKQTISDPAYLALMNDQSLRTIVIAGRPDLGHPDWKHGASGPLMEQDVSDIVAYLHSLRSDTPGQPYPDRSVTR